jgi:hypothetical protein
MGHGKVKTFIDEMFHDEIVKGALVVGIVGIAAQKFATRILKEFSR